MGKYVQSALMVCGVMFVILFGVAMLPILVALVGSVAGVLLAFAPVVIAIVAVVILGRLLDKKERRSK